MIYKTNFKNYLFALLTISMILSCNKSEITEVIIQGNIVNPMGNTIQLVGPGEMEDGTLSLNFQRETNVDENGNFIDTLNLKSSVANLLKIRKETIRKSLEHFQTVEHRLEHVLKINKVNYINDSKATNVNAAYYALDSMQSSTWIRERKIVMNKWGEHVIF